MTTSRSTRQNFAARFWAIAFAVALALGQAVPPAYAAPITENNVVEAVSAAKTPAEHQALADYFAAKAKTATTQAARHRSMAAAHSGKVGVVRRHCTSLARSFVQQAKDYTALAQEQEKLASAK